MPFRTEADGAFIWFFVGIVSVPGLLGLAWASRMIALSSYSHSNILASVIGALVLAHLVFFAFRKIQDFLGRDYVWEIECGNFWGAFKAVVLLELLSAFIYESYDVVSGLTSRTREPIFSFPTFGENQFEMYARDIFHVALILLTIPLVKRLIVAYLDLFATWLAAARELWAARPKNGQSPDTGNTKSEEGRDGRTEQSVVAALPGFQSLSSQAIHRLEARAFFSGAAIVITALAGIFMFQAVFESSATRRANQLIDAIEASPIAFSTQIFDVTRDLVSIAEVIENEASKLRSTDGSGESYLENVLTLSNGQTTLREFFKSTLNQLQALSDTEQTMKAEADGFLARLTELRRELEGVSRTNWDIIVVRTAIILIALVVIGIFQRILMMALQERRAWETKLSALTLLAKSKLDSTDVEAFLKVILAEPQVSVKGPSKGASYAEIDELMARLEKLVNPTPK